MATRCRLLGASLLSAGVLAAVPATASAELAHQQINLETEGRNRIDSIGGFRPFEETLGDAIERFGEVTDVSRPLSEICEVSWGQHGVTIEFLNLSGFDDPCDPELRAHTAYITGRGWHTARDLYITSQQSTMERLYREQRRSARRYSLVRGYRPFGDGGNLDILSVGLTDNRVSSFRMYIGAAGE